jgi:hypothetical protein
MGREAVWITDVTARVGNIQGISDLARDFLMAQNRQAGTVLNGSPIRAARRAGEIMCWVAIAQ